MHKTSRLKGFHLHATDGEIGHVDDFLVDQAWKVAYLVVDTSNWIGGKSVLVSPSAIVKIDVEAEEIRVRMSRKEIQASPSVETADIEALGPGALPPLKASALEVLDGHPVHDKLFGDRHPEGRQTPECLPIVLETGTEVVLGLREVPAAGFGRGRLSFRADRRSANTRDGRAQ